MSIEVQIDPRLRDFTRGQDIVEVNGNTVEQCLEHLAEQFPGIRQWIFNKEGKLLVDLLIFVNGEFFASGESIYQEKLARRVKDGDKLAILFVLGAG